ncbi:MAG: hypothetical protein WC560_09890 [Syntrophales bacterium]
MLATVTKEQTDNIYINRELVCRYIGYSEDVEPSPRIASLLDEHIDDASHLIEPSYSYVIKKVKSIKESRAIIEDSTVFESDVISRLLVRCSKVAVFVLTIGNRLEENVVKLAENRMILESYLLDAIGSSAVESLADIVQEHIGETVGKNGLAISLRYSPGYCDWNINQQKLVFRALGKHTSPVQLSSECLMTPQKSISGIIGIGPRENGVTKYNPCKTCAKHNCVGRNRR